MLYIRQSWIGILFENCLFIVNLISLIRVYAVIACGEAGLPTWSRVFYDCVVNQLTQAIMTIDGRLACLSNLLLAPK